MIVVDNSGAGAIRAMQITSPRLRIIENSVNVGFGAAINQGWRASACRYVATLNDDAVASPDWLRLVVAAAEFDPEIGLVASQVRLSDDALDSAGIVLSRDGSSKQRGHGCPPCDYARASDVLMPSGSAALYRREMLDDVGGFADEFFLYCEDTDLGLRARRRGWRCRYVPEAVIYHAYSRSAGRASELKALLVERNRLFLLVRNFPKRMLITAPFMSLARYLWHRLLPHSGQRQSRGLRHFRRESHASSTPRSSGALGSCTTNANFACSTARDTLESLPDRSAVRKAVTRAPDFFAGGRCALRHLTPGPERLLIVIRASTGRRNRASHPRHCGGAASRAGTGDRRRLRRWHSCGSRSGRSNCSASPSPSRAWRSRSGRIQACL